MHEPIRKYWYADQPVITAFFNGLSVSIPEIERYIVGSTRAALPYLKNKELEKSVALIIHEEEAHSRVHDAYNNLLRKQGYNITKFEKFEHQIAEFFNKRSIKTRLAVCICSEFYTAVMSRYLFNTHALDKPNVDERMRALWTWHALEELHHRGIAFDLYLDQNGGYFRRVGIMLLMTVRWVVGHIRYCLSIVAQGKTRIDAKTWLAGLTFAIGPKGFYTNVVLFWFSFFKPGFHPQKDIPLEEGLDKELHHIHVEKHFVEMVENHPETI